MDNRTKRFKTPNIVDRTSKGLPAKGAEIPTVRTLNASGTSFAYIDIGDGEPVVMIHGSLGSFLDFANQWSDFAAEHRVIAYSRRFHPPNSIDPSDTTYTIDLHADDLEAILGALRLRTAHLIGSSWGAYVALALVLRRQDLARTLVLAEPPILPLLRESPVGRILLTHFVRRAIEPAREAFGKHHMRAGVQAFVDRITGRKGSFDVFPAEVQQRLVSASGELRLEFQTPFDSYMPALSPEQLHSIQIPVLLLEGERSTRLFRTIINELELALPKTERVSISRAGHSMQAANPRVYNETVLSFLRKHANRVK
jgi:pimeloyl-ACP methyl ester carboxylesterase